MQNVIGYRDFNVSSLIFKKAENVGKNGSKVIHMEPILLQTPCCRLPFDPFSNSFTINLNEQMYHLIRDIEEAVQKEAICNSKEWFPKIPQEEIRNMFKSSITESDKGYMPSMKIPYDEECEFFNSDNTLAPRTKLIKGSEVRLLLTIPKINVKVRCGVTTFNIVWELYQLKFAKDCQPLHEECPQTFSFLED